MSEKVTTKNSVTFDNGNTVVLDNNGKKLDVKSLSDDDLISYRNKVRNDGGDTSEYQNEINRRYNSDPKKYESWGAKKPAKKEEPKKEPKKQNKTTSPSAAPEGHSQMEEDRKLENEKAQKLMNTLTTGTSIGADGKIKTPISINDPIANNAKKQLEKSIKDGSFEEKSKKDYAEAKEEYSINKDPLTLSKEQFDKSKFSLIDVIKAAKEKGWSAKETEKYLNSISDVWKKGGEATTLYHNLFGLEAAKDAHDQENKEWKEHKEQQDKAYEEQRAKWDAEKEAEAKKIEEATKDMTEEEKKAYLKKINADKSIYERLGFAPSEAAMMEDVREGMMAAGEKGRRPKGALEGALIEEEQQRKREEAKNKALSEKNKPAEEDKSAATGNGEGNPTGKPTGKSTSTSNTTSNEPSNTRDVKEDLDTLIKAKNEIARLESELAKTTDPDKKKEIETRLEDAKGRFSAITDYYQLDMDQVLNYGKEGKDVEEAVRSNHENEGWLTNAWVKQARRARANKKAIQKELDAAKAAGKDTTEIEKRLQDAKDELSSIHSKYSYFLYDAIRTGLKNMAIPGAYGHGPGNEKSLWDKAVSTNLDADLNRHNKARDASVQELIDGLANRHGVEAEQVKAANDLLNNEKAVRQASRLGILDSLDKLESAINMKNKLNIENWEDAIWVMQLMGIDPTSAGAITLVNKIADSFRKDPKEEIL